MLPVPGVGIVVTSEAPLMVVDTTTDGPSMKKTEVETHQAQLGGMLDLRGALGHATNGADRRESTGAREGILFGTCHG